MCMFMASIHGPVHALRMILLLLLLLLLLL
jgi:hypothetical protein